ADEIPQCAGLRAHGCSDGALWTERAEAGATRALVTPRCAVNAVRTAVSRLIPTRDTARARGRSEARGESAGRACAASSQPVNGCVVPRAARHAGSST